MSILKNIGLPLSIVLISFSTSFAADLEREKRMADEIVDSILDGDAVYLEAGESEFLSIYTEAAGENDVPHGTVIILHGRGFHPDWQDAINPLRVGLTESGWNTLSLQMPVLEKQSKYYDYLPLFSESVPRIDVAITYATEQNKGKGKIVLIAHSCGAHMAMAWAAVDSSESIDAYVGIGMGATDYKQPMLQAFPLDEMQVPVLDVYAENDYPAVIKMAAERNRMIKLTSIKSRQVMIEDANHYYVDRGESLTQVVSEWLKSL